MAPDAPIFDRNGNRDYAAERARDAADARAEYRRLFERVATLEGEMAAIQEQVRTLTHQTANRFP